MVSRASLERRVPADRRSQTFRSLALGSFLRRRLGPRRIQDASFAGTDVYAPQWLAAGVLILVLCAVDALLTLMLLERGAFEANPIMDAVVHGDARIFVALKFGLTSAGVVILTILGQVRVFGVLPVSALLYAVLAGYLWLVLYEFGLLRLVAPDLF